MKIVRLTLVMFTLCRFAALAQQAMPQTSPAAGGIEMYPVHDWGPAASAWPR
ncbi:MAG TPA: hypothetical protein VE083_12665 [Terriglobales bacterium]|nr:hypothetical protein [Terriglobales bacterium]